MRKFATTYQEEAAKIGKEYNSPVRQNRINKYLNLLRVQELEATGSDASSCLPKVLKLIL